MVDGPQYFDDDDIFETYWRNRKRPDNPNAALEKPVILELIGNVKYAAILDLACGAGDFGEFLIHMGCRSYTGIEASSKMIGQARQLLKSDKVRLIHTRIEDYDFPLDTYHLVVSRLALHYVEDIPCLFDKIRQSLKQGGRLVFSVEHPVLTSSDQSTREVGGKRSNWIVDNYFNTGRRNVIWMGKEVVKYHRTIEDYFRILQESGFTIHSLRESLPRKENFVDHDEFKRRQRIPMFLFFCAQPLNDS